ncbi:hypothetical protein ABIE13_005180 [Ottowia thiooxydans]|uniref:Uncharacterized protein n=1 Tax=Ottowia thiooxydans TaxID=219182 RepID=A0ABV2QGJ9_9BURK
MPHAPRGFFTPLCRWLAKKNETTSISFYFLRCLVAGPLQLPLGKFAAFHAETMCEGVLS